MNAVELFGLGIFVRSLVFAAVCFIASRLSGSIPRRPHVRETIPEDNWRELARRLLFASVFGLIIIIIA